MAWRIEVLVVLLVLTCKLQSTTTVQTGADEQPKGLVYEQTTIEHRRFRGMKKQYHHKKLNAEPIEDQDSEEDPPSPPPVQCYTAPLPRADEVKQFMYSLAKADDTRATPQAVEYLREAFTACPMCELPRTFAPAYGSNTFRAFEFSGFPDRQYLVHSLLPELLHLGVKSCVMVGSQPYTVRYEYLMPGVNYTTIELDPRMAVYGSSQQHIVGPVHVLPDHIPAGTIDAVVINGVFGWGINTYQDLRRTIKAIHRVLKRHGIMVVGWNKGMPPCCENRKQFEPYFELAGLGILPDHVEFHTGVGFVSAHMYDTYRAKDVGGPAVE